VRSLDYFFERGPRKIELLLYGWEFKGLVFGLFHRRFGGRGHWNVGRSGKGGKFIFVTFLFLGGILLTDENEDGFEKLVSFFVSELSFRHRELCKIIISQRIIQSFNSTAGEGIWYSFN